MLNKYENLSANIKDIAEKCGFGNYYSLLTPEKGICHGLVCAWGQAILKKDTKSYFSRLDILTRNYELDPIILNQGRENERGYTLLSSFLSDVIITFERGASRYKGVGQANYYHGAHEYIGIPHAQYKLYISIRSFLDVLVMYQNSELSALPREQTSLQNIKKSSELVFNSGMANEEPNSLLEIYNKPFVNRVEGYVEILNSLIHAVSNLQTPFFVVVGSIEHTVGICFDEVTHNVVFYDANLMGYDRYTIRANWTKSQSVTEPDIGKKLASLLFRLFGGETEDGDFLSLNVGVYVSSNSPGNILGSIVGSSISESVFSELIAQFVYVLDHGSTISSIIKTQILRSKDKVDRIQRSVSPKRIEELLNYLAYEMDTPEFQGEIQAGGSKYCQILSSTCARIRRIILSDENKKYMEVYLPNMIGLIGSGVRRFTRLVSIKGHVDVLEKMRGYPKINFDDSLKDHFSPIQYACIYGHVEIFNLFISGRLRCDIKKTFSNSGSTLLHQACFAGSSGIVKKLVTLPFVRPFLVERVVYGFDTPLYIACKFGCTEVVAELLKSPEIDVNGTRFGEIPPFNIACRNGHFGVVEKFIDARCIICRNNMSGHRKKVDTSSFKSGFNDANENLKKLISERTGYRPTR